MSLGRALPFDDKSFFVFCGLYFNQGVDGSRNRVFDAESKLMCGIYGYVGPKEEGLMVRMSSLLQHRGPDDSGEYEAVGVGLGHNRLSIIDVAGGHQPFSSEDGKVWVVANGEIYNHGSLRKRLEQQGHRFRSGSDCEVLVHLYEEQGLDFVEELNGMFAFALWDDRERKLVLGRDRLGIRPVYYAEVAEGLLFASESKGLLASHRVDRELNLTAVDEYLSLRYAQEPFFRVIRRIKPGCIAVWQDGKVRHDRYWQLPDQKLSERRVTGDLCKTFHTLLEESVQMRLMSDVPIGLYLSGGVDSGLMAALVRQVTSRPVHTFSIGFGRTDDELVRARELAHMLGLEHHEAIFSEEDLLNLPEIVWFLDEPIGDSIILPTYHLGRMAKDLVKVVLTGEGADELFGGYVHHRTLRALEKILGKVSPTWVSSVLSRWVGKVPLWVLDSVFHYPASVGVEGRSRLQALLKDWNHPSRAFSNIGRLFSEEEKQVLYTEDFKSQLNPEPRTPNDYFPGVPRKELLDALLDHEMKTWLPDYTLHKQDRLLMAHSLEGRVPYLDHRLVAEISGVPFFQKWHRGQDKYFLRKAAQRVLPKSIATRKKQAFFLPLEGRFQKVILQLVGRFLGRKQILKRGFFRPEAVEELIKGTRSGSLLYGKKLMALLILEIWFRVHLDNDLDINKHGVPTHA